MSLSKHLNEALETSHISDRFKTRIMAMPSNAIKNKIKRQILKKYNTVKSNTYDVDTAVRIASLDIHKDSELYKNVNGRGYYSIIDFLGKDSTGDEIWCIIRNNKIISIMLRKSIQPTDKLRVEKIIK